MGTTDHPRVSPRIMGQPEGLAAPEAPALWGPRAVAQPWRLSIVWNSGSAGRRGSWRLAWIREASTEEEHPEEEAVGRGTRRRSRHHARVRPRRRGRPQPEAVTVRLLPWSLVSVWESAAWTARCLLRTALGIGRSASGVLEDTRNNNRGHACVIL